MAVVRCPRCRDEVTVPPGATNRALVRCPLCLDQYLLSEALANAPPLLVIIGGEVPQAAIEHSVATGHDYQLEETFAHSPDSHWGHAATATLAPRASTVRRTRKREPNMVLMLLSWVGGGVLGLALAPIILWWIFRVDPVEIGPTVAVYAPWVVPRQFRGRATIPPPDFEPVVQPSRRRSKESPSAEESTVVQKIQAAEEAQPLPEITEPTRSADPISPTRVDENASPRPPMPDLKDLIP